MVEGTGDTGGAATEDETGAGAYGRAIEEAVKELRAAVPGVVSEAAAVTFAAGPGGPGGGVFTVPYMDATLRVSYPAGVVSAGGERAVVAVTIVVLHYLARSVGPLDLSEPVRFAGLPGAGAYTAAFRSHAEIPLLQRFGEDGDAYVRALRALGGRPVADWGVRGTGAAEEADATAADDPEVVWRVPFLPNLPLGIRLGLAEDGMPGECVVMFPRRAGFAYHVEDLAVAGELMSARLLQAAEALEAAGGEVDLSVLATFFDPTEAELVVGKLRSAGIEAIVQGDALSVVYGLSMEGHARHHVLVRSDDLVEARGALDLGPGRPERRADAGDGSGEV
ncbi:MAG: DUF3786 domain-containing protein [Thermoleophilia bacterium]